MKWNLYFNKQILHRGVVVQLTKDHNDMIAIIDDYLSEYEGHTYAICKLPAVTPDMEGRTIKAIAKRELATFTYDDPTRYEMVDGSDIALYGTLFDL